MAFTSKEQGAKESSTTMNTQMWYSKHEPRYVRLVIINEDGTMEEVITTKKHDGHLNQCSFMNHMHKKIIILEASPDITSTCLQISGSKWTGSNEFHSGKIGKSRAAQLKFLAMGTVQSKPSDTPKFIAYFCDCVNFTKQCYRKFPNQFSSIINAAQSAEQECMLEGTLILATCLPDTMNTGKFLQKFYLAIYRMFKRHNKNKEVT